MKKSISAVMATTTTCKREQIEFDDETGLIIRRGDLELAKVDYYFENECILFAGMTDIHIHAREDVSGKHLYKEDYFSASQAAINGGVTTAADMPNNPIPPIDDSSYLAKLNLTKKSLIPMLVYAGIGPKTKPLNFAVPYKAYMGPSVGDLFFENDQQLDETLASYKDKWVSFHCEDPVELEACKNEDEHFKRRPKKAEYLATITALQLIRKHHLKGKLCHYSASEGLELIKQAKDEGLPLTCEVTPQHLYYSYDEIRKKDWKFYQMNPPLRTQDDRFKMIEGLRSGVIDFLATDHAPHSQEEKDQGHSGLTGLDTYAGVVSWLIKEHQFSPQDMARVCCENPGIFVNPFIQSLKEHFSPYQNLGKGVGFLEPGFAANFTVLNMSKPYQVIKEDLKTKVKHSPFLGVTFPGSVERVFVKGKVCHV